ncbi:Uncharacterised protein [Mycobacterium tuberculosis]|nr:Uncharacterised protein [Mycobacterium tuberculosis]
MLNVPPGDDSAHMRSRIGTVDNDLGKDVALDRVGHRALQMGLECGRKPGGKDGAQNREPDRRADRPLSTHDAGRHARTLGGDRGHGDGRDRRQAQRDAAPAQAQPDQDQGRAPVLAEDEHEQTQHQHAQPRQDGNACSDPANQVPNKWRHDGHGRTERKDHQAGHARGIAAHVLQELGGEQQHPIDGEEHRADGRDGQGV